MRTEPPNEHHLRAGARLGPYEVLERIGSGGMGEVYRAHDGRLGRDVALKILPPVFASDRERLSRFRREARLLASLNHPNIAAIYGLEETDGAICLVLELVGGEALGGPVPVSTALELAGQIAEALGAAHEKGIVHRDLKPANIKVAGDGRVKVLDFGLAKALGEVDELDHATQWMTSVDPTTHARPVLGTPPYMSPEQAGGGVVDARTDIWAFGCVLYEMLTGRRAFAGRTMEATLAAILDRDPEWGALPADTPKKIRTLLQSCLEKDPAKRLQHIRRAHDEIRQVQRRSPRRLAVSVAAASIVSVVAGSGAWWIWRDGSLPGRDEWVQLTRFSDSAGQPALSPDGRMLTFIRGTSTFVTAGQVYVKALPDGEAIQLTNDDDLKMDPVFSPDGSRIAYTVNESNRWDTWIVPVVRGEPRLWLENASGLTWFGDDRILLSEIKNDDIHMAVVAADDDRADARDVYIPEGTRGMAHRSSVSPDGAWVLVVEMDRGIWQPCRLIAMDGGSPSRTVGPPGAACTSAAWSPDGRWMYFSASPAGSFHIWRQRFPDGRPEQVTSGPTEEEGIAVTPDGSALITAVVLRQSAVYLHDGARERQISLEGYAFDSKFTPDGRSLLFRTLRGTLVTDPGELWIADVASGRVESLLPGVPVTGNVSQAYDVSADGQEVVAASIDSAGNRSLWLVRLDRQSPPVEIPDARGDQPFFGAGDEILFRGFEEGSAYVHGIRKDGTGRRRVYDEPVAGIRAVSPDREWFVVRHPGPGSSTAQLAISAEDGTAVRFGAVGVETRINDAIVRWSADGRSLSLSPGSSVVPSGGAGRTYILPVPVGRTLPDMPEGGFRSEEELAGWPGVTVIEEFDVTPGPASGVYALTRVTGTRNLYRVPLR